MKKQNPGHAFLPFSLPAIGEEEINEVVNTLKSGWITTGNKTKKFENDFKVYIGCKEAIALSSCTAALHLALVASGAGKGDEVITTPFTFAATGEVINYVGAKPVFVDIKKDTYNIDPDAIEKAITPRTRAIIPVHYAGQPCDMDEILKIAHDHDLVVIEDAAHAVGAKYKNRMIGTIGDYTAFSFYATKNLTTAEGGMVTTENLENAEKMRILGLHGMSKDAWKRYGAGGSWFYEIMEAGYKYNMTDIQASIGIHQLARFEKLQEKRSLYAKRYTEELQDIRGIKTPYVHPDISHAWHLYTILIDSEMAGLDRNQFIDAMTRQNIGTSVHFIPLHLHPYYQKVHGYKIGDFPNAEYIYNRIVSLPLYPSMTHDDLDYVITTIKEIIN